MRSVSNRRSRDCRGRLGPRARPWALAVVWTVGSFLGTAPTRAGELPSRIAIRPPLSDPGGAVAAALESEIAEISATLGDFPMTAGVAVTAEPGADGDVVVQPATWPLEPSLAKDLAKLPVSLGPRGMTVAGRRYDPEVHTVAVRLPDAGAARWLVVGTRPPAVASLVRRVVYQSLGIRDRLDPHPIDFWIVESWYLDRRGSWRATADGWDADPAAERDEIGECRDRFAALDALPGSAVTLRAPATLVAAPRGASWAGSLDRAAATMAVRAGAPGPAVEVFVVPDYVVQGRCTGAVGAAIVQRGAVYALDEPGDEEFHRWGVARALASRLSALVDRPWMLDGAALWLSEDWFGRDRRAWLPLLRAADLVPTADELLASERQSAGSEVLWPPAAAAVFDALPGVTLREKLARGLDPRVVDDALRSVGRDASAAAGASARPAEARPAEARPAEARPARAGDTAAFLAGVSLAHQPGLERGYQAPGVDEVLARLTSLGADSVSLMPFAYQRHADRPSLSYLNKNPSSENDAGMVFVARRARRHGLSVLWKPHVWVDGGGWPGDVAMADEADWRDWWLAYRRFIVHQAVLAAWAEADLFSIGVELGKTLGREREWRHLIAAVRAVFPGRLTYAGNWWGDYDRAPFWDALDLVGVDAYFPLAAAADAGDEALLAGARRAVAELRAASERFGRPIVLTETGFAVREGAWVAPHEEGGSHSEADQVRAYRAWLTALGRPPWLAGVFFWKAFSDPRWSPGPSTDFSFLGRPAEELVRRYWNAEPEPPEPPSRASER